jgi:hypothetical protein
VQCSMHNYQVLGYEGMCFLLEHWKLNIANWKLFFNTKYAIQKT